MARGKRPVVAIGEAKRRAAAWGFALIEMVIEAGTPVDFAFHDNGKISFVRVRRLKYNAYRAETVRVSCAQEIREFRELVLPEGIDRELWVRGMNRQWHRYRIGADTIEEVKDFLHPGLFPSGTGTEGGT
jgi:hypothetical protein